MIDEYINKGKVAASLSWAFVLALILTAWVLVILVPAHWKLGMLFAATACAFSTFAAVLHIRCYVVRLAGLVRAGDAIQRADGVRPVSHI